MRSNIKIQKNCEFCGNEFTARTLYTRYCSKSCNKKHYKQLLLKKNLNTKETQESIKISPIEILRNTSQDYFEVHEAAQIMRVSRATLYRLIMAKKFKTKKSCHARLSPTTTSNHFLPNNKVIAMKKKEVKKKSL